MGSSIWSFVRKTYARPKTNAVLGQVTGHRLFCSLVEPQDKLSSSHGRLLTRGTPPGASIRFYSNRGGVLRNRKECLLSECLSTCDGREAQLGSLKLSILGVHALAKSPSSNWCCVQYRIINIRPEFGTLLSPPSLLSALFALHLSSPSARQSRLSGTIQW